MTTLFDVPARLATKADGIDSLESVAGLLNVYKFGLSASNLFRLEWPGRQKRRKSSKGRYNYKSETRSKKERERIQIGGILPDTAPARAGGEGRPLSVITI